MDLPLAVVFAALRRHGARPLRSTEAEVEAVALPQVVMTWASAVLAVTTSAVLDDPCVVMMLEMTCVR